jgi:hypothetical protein
MTVDPRQIARMISEDPNDPYPNYVGHMSPAWKKRKRLANPDPDACVYCGAKFSPHRGVNILSCDECDKSVCAANPAGSCMDAKEWHYDYATDTGADILCPTCIANASMEFPDDGEQDAEALWDWAMESKKIAKMISEDPDVTPWKKKKVGRQPVNHPWISVPRPDPGDHTSWDPNDPNYDPKSCVYCGTKFAPQHGINIFSCDECDKSVCAYAGYKGTTKDLQKSCLHTKEWHYDYTGKQGSPSADILCPTCIANASINHPGDGEQDSEALWGWATESKKIARMIAD